MVPISACHVISHWENKEGANLKGICPQSFMNMIIMQKYQKNMQWKLNKYIFLACDSVFFASIISPNSLSYVVSSFAKYFSALGLINLPQYVHCCYPPPITLFCLVL